ncbi:MAG: hypothetical protein AAFY25_11920 [Pseudomonadota bacterium]
MRQAFAIFGIFAALATPVWAVTDEWQDLQDRCTEAVMAGEKLNVAGLEDRLPDFLFDLVEDDLLGPRVEPNFSGPGGRTVPTGVWGTDGGAFEMWLIEYPTQAGFRAICEVREARGGTLAHTDLAYLTQVFARLDAEKINVSTQGLMAFRLSAENARGCPVVTSLSTHSRLRSSVSEAAGVPECGGPSLARDVITPHGILQEVKG